MILAACAAVFLFAVAINYICGFHYFQDYHPSVVFDGGYRVYLGQVPFRDFFSPVGPMLFWMQALFFRIFGVNYFAYVTLAAWMNVLATSLAMMAVWQNCRNARLSVVVGLLTAAWYMPMSFGTPWYTSVAFLFLFFAFGFLLCRPAGSSGGVPGFLAGIAVALAFYSKQPIGVAGGFFLLFYLAQISSRSMVCFASGCMAGVLLLTTALIGMGGAWSNIARYFIIIPLGILEQRLDAPLRVFLAAGIVLSSLLLLFRKERGLWPIAVVFMFLSLLDGRAMSAYFFLPLFALCFMQDRHDRTLLLVLTLTQYAGCYFSSARGEDYKYWPFVGLQFFLIWKGWKAWYGNSIHRERLEHWMGNLPLGEIPAGGAFIFLMFMGLRKSLNMLLGPLPMVPVLEPTLGLLFLAAGCRILAASREKGRLFAATGLVCLCMGSVGMFRGLQAYHFNKTFKLERPHSDLRPVRVKGLRGLRMNSKEAASLEMAAAYLANLPPEGKPFFIYQNYFILHALLGQPSPQPFVWFDEGLTHRRGELDEARLCDSLQKNNVRTIVLVNKNGVNYDSVPCLERWLSSDFLADRMIFPFYFYRRRVSGGVLRIEKPA